MKDTLRFRNMQDMQNEAEEFLTKISDPEIKTCAKFLLIAGYAYISDYISDVKKKTYTNLAILIHNEMIPYVKKADTDVAFEGSELAALFARVPSNSTARRVYELYDACDVQMKKYAVMRLMDLLLTYYIK